MAVLPAIHGTGNNPKLPLVTQVGTIWLPRVASDPCTCCKPLCQCCTYWVANVTETTIIISGHVDHSCSPFTIYGESASSEKWSVLNGTYTVPGHTGDIFWGTLGSIANPGRLFVDASYFSGPNCRTYIYGCRVGVGGCPGIGWVITFYLHRFANNIYQPGLAACSGHPGAVVLQVGANWADVCTMVAPTAIATNPHGGCAPAPTGTWNILGSSKCDGCVCP